MAEAGVNFSTRAAEGQALVQVLGPIIAGLVQGAPDCWPKIRSAVNAITVAANRATTRAWQTVDARDITIRRLNTEISSILNTTYALRNALGQQRQQTDYQAARARQLEQTARDLRSQLSQAETHVRTLHTALTNAQYGAARERQALAYSYNRALTNSEKQRKDCESNVAILRLTETDCQQKVKQCKQCVK